VRVKRRAPAIIKSLSRILRRALPIKGLNDKEEKKKIPMRTPISDSVDPNLER
jgi:hypothetical protein